MMLESIQAGILQFENQVYPSHQRLFERLTKEGQHPKALLITCSDSRIDTAMMTQTAPGELFVIRNTGNIIPPYGSGCHGEIASLEYALGELDIQHIIVCGHLGCGAMSHLLHASESAKTHNCCNSMNDWLHYAERARNLALATSLSGQALADFEVRANVWVQIQHLISYPFVSERFINRLLTIHAWVYDIAHGHVDMYKDWNRLLDVEKSPGDNLTTLSSFMEVA